jgi:hypothetical protein
MAQASTPVTQFLAALDAGDVELVRRLLHPRISLVTPCVIHAVRASGIISAS